MRNRMGIQEFLIQKDNTGQSNQNRLSRTLDKSPKLPQNVEVLSQTFLTILYYVRLFFL